MLAVCVSETFLVSGYKCNNKRLLKCCFSLQFLSNLEPFDGKYALQIRVLGENSALPQALTSVTFVIDSVDNYYFVIIEHALIYHFTGTDIFETLLNQST